MHFIELKFMSDSILKIANKFALFVFCLSVCFTKAIKINQLPINRINFFIKF